MNNKKGFLVSFSVFLLLVGLTIPLFMSLHKKVKAETITDLTNTSWTLNSVPSNSSPYFGQYADFVFSINFVSNSTNYDGLFLNDANEDEIRYIYYIIGSNRTSVVSGNLASGGSMLSQYTNITITGGTDVTNIYLINWLTKNATQQQTGTQIIHKYWSPDGIITLTDNQQVIDDNIQYTVLYNEFNDSYEGTIQTGLNIYNGYNDSLDLPWSYINSNNHSLYNGASNNINNAMWLEFTLGDVMDSDLYDFLTLWGTWFDDQGAYLAGINQGYAEGIVVGRAQGQADGTQYTGLLTGIFNGLGGLFNIQVFPNITIGLLIGLPLLLGVFVIIIKILRG